jgi:hypothetical protein
MVPASSNLRNKEVESKSLRAKINLCNVDESGSVAKIIFKVRKFLERISLGSNLKQRGHKLCLLHHITTKIIFSFRQPSSPDRPKG